MTDLALGVDSESFDRNDFAGMRLIAFALVTAAACWFQRGWSNQPGAAHPVVDVIALVAIAIAIWHGAYDGVLARPLFERRLGRWWTSTFAVGYLLLAGAVFVAWHLQPEFALVAFLAYSSWHFGTEQESEPLSPRRAVAAFAGGALPIAAACHWHPDQVMTIFRSMLGSRSENAFPQQLIHACGALLWVLALVAVVGALPHILTALKTTRTSLLCLIALELTLFWCCDPVLAFAIYFCCWHTPEHLVSSSRDNNACYSARIMVSNLRAGMFPWLVSLAGLAVMLTLQPRIMTMYVSAIFIFLSALTVPHMALNELSRLVSRRRLSRATAAQHCARPIA